MPSQSGDRSEGILATAAGNWDPAEEGFVLPFATLVPPGQSMTPRAPTAKWRRRLAGLAVVGLPLIFAGLAFLLSQSSPRFYRQRLSVDSVEQSVALSNQFLNTASRLLGDIQNMRTWQAEFGEEQINGWLAHDFQINHAEKSLPPGVSRPRVEIAGDEIKLGFRWQWGPFSSVIQIGVRAWVPKRNLLCVEIESVRAGMLPLPTTYTRKVIDQFVQTQNLNIRWKRNGGRLVALIDFERSQRRIVLHKVQIQSDGLYLEGLSSRHALPHTDYAPSAN